MIETFGLIIGAMKCGTTSLYRYLVRHPAVAACREKEPNFFAKRDREPGSIEEYESLWDWNPEVHRVALEGSTHYTKVPRFPDAAERLASYDRDFRFVYLVRHPVERIESHIAHGLAEGWLEPNRPIEARRQTLNVTRYAMQLERYTRQFEASRMLVLAFDELVEEPTTAVGRVFEHLGVEPRDVAAGDAHNRRKDRLGAVGRMVDGVAGQLPRRWRAGLSYRLGQPVGDYRLDERERAYVFDELEEDLRELERCWEVDVERWLPN